MNHAVYRVGGYIRWRGVTWRTYSARAFGRIQYVLVDSTRYVVLAWPFDRAIMCHDDLTDHAIVVADEPRAAIDAVVLTHRGRRVARAVDHLLGLPHVASAIRLAHEVPA